MAKGRIIVRHIWRIIGLKRALVSLLQIAYLLRKD